MLYIHIHYIYYEIRRKTYICICIYELHMNIYIYIYMCIHTYDSVSLDITAFSHVTEERCKVQRLSPTPRFRKASLPWIFLHWWLVLTQVCCFDPARCSWIRHRIIDEPDFIRHWYIYIYIYLYDTTPARGSQTEFYLHHRMANLMVWLSQANLGLGT